MTQKLLTSIGVGLVFVGLILSPQSFADIDQDSVVGIWLFEGNTDDSSGNACYQTFRKVERRKRNGRDKHLYPNRAFQQANDENGKCLEQESLNKGRNQEQKNKHDCNWKGEELSL